MLKVCRPPWLAEFIGNNSEREPLKDHCSKTWTPIGQAVSEEIFKTFFPQEPMLKLCRLMSAALVGGWGHGTQF